MVIILSMDREEETGKCLMGRGHWVSDISYNQSKLSFNFELETDMAVAQCNFSF